MNYAMWMPFAEQNLLLWLRFVCFITLPRGCLCSASLFETLSSWESSKSHRFLNLASIQNFVFLFERKNSSNIFNFESNVVKTLKLFGREWGSKQTNLFAIRKRCCFDFSSSIAFSIFDISYLRISRTNFVRRFCWKMFCGETITNANESENGLNEREMRNKFQLSECSSYFSTSFYNPRAVNFWLNFRNSFSA